MKVKDLISMLSKFDEENMVIFTLHDEDKFIWYPDISVCLIRDRFDDYVSLSSETMSKELYSHKEK